MKNIIRVSFAVIGLLSVAGCATGSSVQVGRSRPSVPVEAVKLYLEPPKKFEIVGIVEAASKGGGSSQSKTNRAITRLKEEAAKIGGNGVLLEGVNSEIGGFSGGYNNGFIYGHNILNKTVSGKAIFVTEE